MAIETPALRYGSEFAGAFRWLWYRLRHSALRIVIIAFYLQDCAILDSALFVRCQRSCLWPGDAYHALPFLATQFAAVKLVIMFIPWV